MKTLIVVIAAVAVLMPGAASAGPVRAVAGVAVSAGAMAGKGAVAVGSKAGRVVWRGLKALW